MNYQEDPVDTLHREILRTVEFKAVGKKTGKYQDKYRHQVNQDEDQRFINDYIAMSEYSPKD